MHKLFFGVLLLLFTACGSAGNSSKVAALKTGEQKEKTVNRKPFDADSAYQRIAEQVAFGPRVPGTDAHKKCEQYIAEKLQGYGADTVWVQRGVMKAFNGENLPVANVLASFNESAARRILFVAHYDTRPWADQEVDASKRNKPILGANDGGSGVGVMLEMARVIGMQLPKVGIDFLFTDVEDYGAPEDEGTGEDSWCLGTQFWAQNKPYSSGNRPVYGVVLDMVGGVEARFHREYTSCRFAPSVVDRVWGMAASTEYASFFPNEIGGAIVDDHHYVNSVGIPCVDVVESSNSETGGFPPTWHTHDDNMDNIDRSTLKAVGEVMLKLVYSEPAE